MRERCRSPDPGTLAVFVAAAVALLVVPGPAVLYIVAQSIEHADRRARVHARDPGRRPRARRGGGVGPLRASRSRRSPSMSSVRWRGISQLPRAAEAPHPRALRDDGRAPAEAARPPLLQGIVVNILNPKTALFFFAFLPQFVSVEEGAVGLQIAVLGLLFILIAMISDGLYALRCRHGVGLASEGAVFSARNAGCPNGPRPSGV